MSGRSAQATEAQREGGREGGEEGREGERENERERKGVHSLFTNPRQNARIHHPPRGTQAACAQGSC